MVSSKSDGENLYTCALYDSHREVLNILVKAIAQFFSHLLRPPLSVHYLELSDISALIVFVRPCPFASVKVESVEQICESVELSLRFQLVRKDLKTIKALMTIDDGPY